MEKTYSVIMEEETRGKDQKKDQETKQRKGDR